MRHPVAQQLAAALRDDAQPSARIVLEMIAFEGIKLVTNKDGDRHWPSLRMLCLRRGVFCRRCRNATRFLTVASPSPVPMQIGTVHAGGRLWGDATDRAAKAQKRNTARRAACGTQRP